MGQTHAAGLTTFASLNVQRQSFTAKSASSSRRSASGCRAKNRSLHLVRVSDRSFSNRRAGMVRRRSCLRTQIPECRLFSTDLPPAPRLARLAQPGSRLKGGYERRLGYEFGNYVLYGIRKLARNDRTVAIWRKHDTRSQLHCWLQRPHYKIRKHIG